MAATHVVLGDGIAGSTAAATIRQADSRARIAIFTDEGEPLYNRILTKEFAKGKLPEDPIAIHDATWYDERDIDLHVNTYVTDVDPNDGVLYTHENGQFSFDKLLIATGGTPRQLGVDGSDASGIHHFWTFQDARAIRSHAEHAERGVIVGAGLLGLDLAAVCAAQDVPATYLMRGTSWWRHALSEEGGRLIHRALRDRRVEPVFNRTVTRFERDSDRVIATIDDRGERHTSDFVGIAIGLNLNVESVQDAGIIIDDGIVVDEYMRTNHADVYAAGDITRFFDVITGEHEQNGSWGSAKAQGRVAGRNMVADAPVERFRWVASYSITHFDFPFLSFGHPTRGDRYLDRADGDTYRRLAIRDGHLVGGVLIGNLAPQMTFKRLIKERIPIGGREQALLASHVDSAALLPDAGGEPAT